MFSGFPINCTEPLPCDMFYTDRQNLKMTHLNYTKTPDIDNDKNKFNKVPVT